MQTTLSRILLNLSLFLLLGTATFGQAALGKGDRLLERKVYYKAAEAYQRAYEKVPSERAVLGAAESFRALGDFKKAAKWYDKAPWEEPIAPKYRFNYAQTLKKVKRYDEAKVQFLRWGQQTNQMNKAEFWANSCNVAAELHQENQGYQIRPLNLNTLYDEICPVPYRKGIVFASRRPRGFFIKLLNRRDGQPFFDLYYSERRPSGKFDTPEIMGGKMTTRLNDGPASFSAPGHIAMVTRSNNRGLFRKSRIDNETKLQLVEARKINEKWRELIPFPWNDRDYTLAHPALSADGNRVIFVSDIPGTLGGLDLWESIRSEDGWSKPRNLGNTINTQGNEVFPSLTEDNTLWFSSDGHAGLGGLDIFSVDLGKRGPQNLENPGPPVNSPADDFGLSWQPGSPTGYFTSNRLGGQGQDDLYMFTRSPAMEIVVAEMPANIALANAEVEIMDVQGRKIKLKTNQEGRIRHYVDAGKKYFLTVSHPELGTVKRMVDTEEASLTKDLEVRVDLVREEHFTVTGFVVDSLTQKPLAGVEVRLLGDGEAKLTTDSLGRFSHEVEPDLSYRLVGQMEGYAPAVAGFETRGLDEPTAVNVRMSMLPGGSWLYVEGIITSRETGKKLPGINIRVVENQTQREVSHVVSNEDGVYWLALAPLQSYSIFASGYGYFALRNDYEVQAGLMRDSVTANFAMISRELGVVTNILHFDYNAADIRAFDKRELNEASYFLLDNPDVYVDLGAHTDSRGSDRYNVELSQKRADAAVEYITERGIPEKRIRAKGLGEADLVNDCADGINCDEEKHQENRRAELKVTDLESDTPKSNK